MNMFSLCLLGFTFKIMDNIDKKNSESANFYFLRLLGILFKILDEHGEPVFAGIYFEIMDNEKYYEPANYSLLGILFKILDEHGEPVFTFKLMIEL